MKSHAHTGSSPHRPPLSAILVVPVVAAVVLTLFAWPNARLEPRDLPLGVAGPPAAAEALERQVGAREGAFDVQRYEGEAAARRAIEAREVYGALVAGSSGPKLLVSSAASPAVAQILSHVAGESGGPSERGVPVEDVVEASPRAGALGASVLPLLIAGILVALVASFATSSTAGRGGLLTAGSVLVGLAAAGVVQGWLDVVGGDWFTNAGVLALTVFAISSALTGLYALLGRGGLLAGVVAMVFVGNPFSAVASAPELLPQPVGTLGQLLPPGAGGSLLRSTGFFDGAAAGGHVVVLAAWVVAGLACLLVASLRAWRPAGEPAEMTS